MNAGDLAVGRDANGAEGRIVSRVSGTVRHAGRTHISRTHITTIQHKGGP